jgi:hypothetical protein
MKSKVVLKNLPKSFCLRFSFLRLSVLFSAFVFLILFCMFIPLSFLSSDGHTIQRVLPNNGAHKWAAAIQEGASQKQPVQRMCSEYIHRYHLFELPVGYIPYVCCYVRKMTRNWTNSGRTRLWNTTIASNDWIFEVLTAVLVKICLVGHDVVYIGNVYASIFIV